jgi:hypothetical protein
LFKGEHVSHGRRRRIGEGGGQGGGGIGGGKKPLSFPYN